MLSSFIKVVIIENKLMVLNNSSSKIIKSPTKAELPKSQIRNETIKNRLKLGSVIVITLVVVLLVLNYVVSITIVNGYSMQPTLQTGNVLVVWKLPQTWAKITNSQYIPKRSNLVIVDDTNNSGVQLVKRVVGFSGEQVNIGNGSVSVINSSHPNGFNPDAAPYGKNLQQTVGDFNETIPDGQIFVLGDNRTPGGSIDSRSSLGAIPSSYIVGHVILRIYPLNKIKLY